MNIRKYGSFQNKAQMTMFSINEIAQNLRNVEIAQKYDKKRPHFQALEPVEQVLTRLIVNPCEKVPQIMKIENTEVSNVSFVGEISKTMDQERYASCAVEQNVCS